MLAPRAAVGPHGPTCAQGTWAPLTKHLSPQGPDSKDVFSEALTAWMLAVEVPAHWGLGEGSLPDLLCACMAEGGQELRRSALVGTLSPTTPVTLSPVTCSQSRHVGSGLQQRNLEGTQRAQSKRLPPLKSSCGQDHTQDLVLRAVPAAGRCGLSEGNLPGPEAEWRLRASCPASRTLSSSPSLSLVSSSCVSEDICRISVAVPLGQATPKLALSILIAERWLLSCSHRRCQCSQ